MRPELRERLVERHRGAIRAKPSPRFLVVANLLQLLPGGKTPVQFRVRSDGLGTWWVDDFYVDPRCR